MQSRGRDSLRAGDNSADAKCTVADSADAKHCGGVIMKNEPAPSLCSRVSKSFLSEHFPNVRKINDFYYSCCTSSIIRFSFVPLLLCPTPFPYSLGFSSYTSLHPWKFLLITSDVSFVLRFLLFQTLFHSLSSLGCELGIAKVSETRLNVAREGGKQTFMGEGA